MRFNVQEILQHARDNGYAIGAFNVANLEALKAVVGATQKLEAPVIVEASAGEIGYVGVRQLRALVDAYVKDIQAPILLNLDHALDEDVIKQSIDVGFDLIHIDAAELPQQENLALTKRVAEWSHAKGLICEGELDHIQGSSQDHRDQNVAEVTKREFYTNPDQAGEFVRQTNIDIFAAFFGNVHGVYNQPPGLDFDLLAQIAEKVDAFLSLHGGSGIRDKDIQKAVEVGKIVKINVNSELRIAFRETLQRSLAQSESVKPYDYYQPVVEAVQSIVEQKIKVFGSSGRGREIEF